MFPENVLKIANELEKVYPSKVGFVGGCLRDTILKKSISDYDIYIVMVGRKGIEKNLHRSFIGTGVIKSCVYNENYEQLKYNEHFKGVFNITTGTGEEVDIILVDHLGKYINSFPCSISRIWMPIFSKELAWSLDFKKALDNKTVVWYPRVCKDNVIPKDYFKKIKSKYSDYVHYQNGT